MLQCKITAGRALLRFLGPWALLMFGVTLVLLPGNPSPAGALHLALALGVLPLVLAAQCHFVPVLTRTRPATTAAWALPLLGLSAGLAGGFGVAHAAGWLPVGLLLGVVTTVAMLGWIQARAEQALGDPHPGLDWYRAALACLFLGLLAMLAALAWPQHWVALKRLHLHLNLLGFVGLSALGTLQVLLPTAAGYADPDTSRRLRRGWPWALAGVLASAGAAAWWPPLAWLAVLAWGLVLGPFALAVLRANRAWLAWHGSGVALAAALGGFVVLLLVGLAHARAGLAPRGALLLLLPLFLLPLVSGALTHLLPLWR
ncbi:MAG TPA: hypothetical protein VIX81_10290, partial [Gammaproteobacteria bacterium]